MIPFLQRLQTNLGDFFRPEQGRNAPSQVASFLPKVDVPSIFKTLRGIVSLPKPQRQLEQFTSPLPTPPSLPLQPPSPSSAGKFGRVSYYLPTGNQTATGTIPQAGRTAAVSPDLLDILPYGTVIMLPDGSTYRVEDRTADSLSSTLDIFSNEPLTDQFPYGLSRDIPYSVVGRDLEGLRYGR